MAFASIVYAIPSVKHLAVTLFAGAGILVAILGLATQRAFSNIISGVFIVGFKPFRVGDLLEVAGHRGTVEDITLRHTVIDTFENRRVIVPNALIGDEVLIDSTISDRPPASSWSSASAMRATWTWPYASCRRRPSPIPAVWTTAPREDLAKGARPKVAVRLIRIADSSLVLRAYAWAAILTDPRAMHFDLNRSVKLRFDREGIEIPTRTGPSQGARPRTSGMKKVGSGRRSRDCLPDR